MPKKNYIRAFALVMLLLFTGSELTAQTRIKFRRGTSSTTVSGRLGRAGVKHYVLGASRGQVLTATLSSDNGHVDFTQGSVHDTQYSHVVEYDGDVDLVIDNHGGPTNYTLTVSIQ